MIRPQHLLDSLLRLRFRRIRVCRARRVGGHAQLCRAARQTLRDRMCDRDGLERLQAMRRRERDMSSGVEVLRVHLHSVPGGEDGLELQWAPYRLVGSAG
jgi:hypothetical protein